MSDMKQLRRADVRVGAPLPWSCYDRDGHLLLRQGVAIAFEHQIDRLIGEGLFVKDRAATKARSGDSESVFERVIAIAWSLRTQFNSLLSVAPAPDVEERLMSRARKILEACSADPDGALATIQQDAQNPYLLSHHVHAAVLCALLGQRLGLDAAALMPVICAALTFDLGLAEFAHLDKQATPLEEEQGAAVQQHPQRAVAILRRAGIENPQWLQIILQHHERWNGSGYPDGRAREDICIGARLLAVADSYTAMTRTRAFRPARTPFEAQGELFKHMGVLYEERICVALIKELGMYPPGSIVRLANREVAVVKGKNRKDGKLLLMAIYDANGMPYMTPQRRDAAAEGHAIARALPQAECRSAAVIVRRLWL